MKRKCKLFRCWILVYIFYNRYLENHGRFINPNFFYQYQSSIKHSYLVHFPAKEQKRKKNTNSPRKNSLYFRKSGKLSWSNIKENFMFL